MSDKIYQLDVVIPCYFEEEALPTTVPKIWAYLDGLVRSQTNGLCGFRLILVNDGSTDGTWNIISSFHAKWHNVVGVKLSRNFGHQNAMLAGLSRADADVVITMDADLQDDLTAVERMLSAYEDGSDLALGVRVDRRSDTFFKRNTANAYYRALALMGVAVVENHADFRLMSRRALKALLDYNEVNLFFRGIVPTIGFKTAVIEYERKPREQGETKYTLSKMLGLAINGITSFSVVPLRLVTVLGFLTSLLAMVLLVWVLTVKLIFPEQSLPGWASTLSPLLLLGGVQLFSTGLLGEYIGKVYLETKRRPRFIVEDVIDAQTSAKASRVSRSRTSAHA